MPRVDAYGGPQVAATPLPGVRRQVHETFESLGGPGAEAQAQLGGTVTQLGGQALQQARQIHQQEQERVVKVAALAGDRQLGDLSESLRVKALTAQGPDALKARESILEEYDAGAVKIAAGLPPHPGVQLALVQARDARRQALASTIDNHALQEMDQYEKSEAKASLDASVNEGVANYTDPLRIRGALDRVFSVVTQHGAALGVPGPEGQALLMNDLRSQIHAGVINSYLENDQDSRASAYFDEVKDQIDAKYLPQLRKNLEEGTLRADSQKASDAIVLAGGTLTEQRAKVRAITDPKLRDEVMKRVEHDAEQQATAARADEEAMLRDAYNAIDKTGNVRSIPPSVWTRLKGSDRTSLIEYANKRTKGEPVETDPASFYTLLTQASADPNGFMQTNLLRYAGALSKSDLAEMMKKQAAMRDGDFKTAQGLLVSESKQKEMVDEALRAIGFDPTPATADQPKFDQAKSDRVTRLRRAVREAALRQESDNGGKPVTDEQMQRIVDTLMVPTTGSSSFFSSPTPAYAFETAQAHIADASLIPRTVKGQIDDALRRQGLAVTDANRITMFNRYLTRVRKDQ